MSLFLKAQAYGDIVTHTDSVMTNQRVLIKVMYVKYSFFVIANCSLYGNA